jgi:hypothetical protein
LQEKKKEGGGGGETNDGGRVERRIVEKTKREEGMMIIRVEMNPKLMVKCSIPREVIWEVPNENGVMCY